MNNLYEIQYLDIKPDEKYDEIISKVVKECFRVENLLDSKLYISITLTTPENIQKYNKQYRNLDKPTDVLSFPMFEKDEIDNKIQNKDFENIDILGDMVISIPKVEEQAKEYGHSFERELAYMVVHGFYHLMGYDHMTDEDKSKMRLKEENVLSKLNIKE
jgi:probable rRNA maturation factor